MLQTVTLMAEALKLDEKAGIETHTGAKGFRNTPVWADHLLTDTEKTTVFTGSAKEVLQSTPVPLICAGLLPAPAQRIWTPCAYFRETLLQNQF